MTLQLSGKVFIKRMVISAFMRLLYPLKIHMSHLLSSHLGSVLFYSNFFIQHINQAK